MSYCVLFTGEVPAEMAQGGSTRKIYVGEAPQLERPDWSMTSNYSKGFDKAFAGVKPAAALEDRKDYGGHSLDYGLWLICEKSPKEQIELLKQGIERLDPGTATDNYWDGTDGNVRRVLEQMLDISVWWLDHHPEMANQVDEGVWYRRTW